MRQPLQCLPSIGHLQTWPRINLPPRACHLNSPNNLNMVMSSQTSSFHIYTYMIHQWHASGFCKPCWKMHLRIKRHCAMTQHQSCSCSCPPAPLMHAHEHA